MWGLSFKLNRSNAINEELGSHIAKELLSNLRFANDADLLVSSIENLEIQVTNIAEEIKKAGFTIITGKKCEPNE